PQKRFMRIVCISDTHGLHDRLELPDGDLLLHAGDFSNRGEIDQVQNFLTWLADQPHPHKVFIAGNHDFLAERQPDVFRGLVPANCTYLEDEGTEVAGLQIWGSPITPWFFDWAFNRRRGEEIDVHWQKIWPATDILLTHGPPYGIRDLTFQGDLAGCADLNRHVWEINPKLHVFGHIHEGYGLTEANDVFFANASNVDLGYKLVNSPLVFDWENGQLTPA
ncbi:MAG: metallophosphatase domain-containing protein, partial [Bacteroidota bacterium]